MTMRPLLCWRTSDPYIGGPSPYASSCERAKHLTNFRRHAWRGVEGPKPTWAWAAVRETLQTLLIMEP
jgi:hypothetical protein